MRPFPLLPRLCVDAELDVGKDVTLSTAQAHYLANVMRLANRAELLVFNGRDGEWLATLHRRGKRDAGLAIERRVREQTPPGRVRLCLAVLRPARFDLAIEKATELGIGSLQPILTQHTQLGGVRQERMQSRAIEAAEQSGALSVPEVLAPRKFTDWLASRDPGRPLVWCDEAAPAVNPVERLRPVASLPLDLAIGPEGGWSAEERAALAAAPRALAISLGRSVLRAETAAIAALVLIAAATAEW